MYNYCGECVEVRGQVARDGFVSPMWILVIEFSLSGLMTSAFSNQALG